MTLPDVCTFIPEHDDGECGRAPVVADYVFTDGMKGEKLVVSCCSRHDGGRKVEAAKRGIERREREQQAKGQIVAFPQVGA